MYNIGIIGLGNIGIRHKKKIAENVNCKLVAVSDTRMERLALAEEGIEQFVDYKDLLKVEEIDVIAVCTPNHLHAEMTIAALNAKKHVICEKPMALTTFDCKQMIAASLQNDRKLFIVKQNRYNPPVQAVKQLLNKGSLGKIFSVVVNCYWNRNDNYYNSSTWKGYKEKDGGALYTQFSHFLDLMYWLAGDPISAVAHAANFAHPSITVEDTGGALLKFRNDVIGTVNFTNCSYGKNMEGSITIFAQHGTVKIGGQYLNELEYQHIQDLKLDNLPVSSGPNDYGTYKGTMSNHHFVYDNVVNTLDGKETIEVNGIEGMKTIEIIEAIYQSIEKNTIVKI